MTRLQEEIPQSILDREKWFNDRICKRVFRNPLTCKCGVCQNVEAEGLIVGDEDHAGYLHICEMDANADGTGLRYFDTKEEVQEWIKENGVI
jgi:hypothetical protein